MMSRCFIGFLISGLGEPNIYHQLVCFTRMWGGFRRERTPNMRKLLLNLSENTTLPHTFADKISQIFPIMLKIVSKTLFLKVRSITTLVVRVEKFYYLCPTQPL